METSTKKLEEITPALDKISFSSVEITAKFKTTQAYSPLISTPAALPKITLDKRERCFETITPVYLRYLTFTGDNLKNIEVTLINSDGSRKIYPITINAASGDVWIREFCTSFVIKSKTRTARPVISSIKAVGFDSSSLGSARAQIISFQAGKKDLETLIAEASSASEASDLKIAENAEKNTELLSKYEKLTTQITEKEAELKKKSSDLSGIQIKIANSSQLLGRLTAEEEAKQNSCAKLTDEISISQEKLSITTKDLNQLLNEKSLISDEFTDYVKEGQAQALMYSKLVILPCLTIILCIILMYNGASDVLFGHYETSQDKLAALLLRIPFAAVLGGAAYYSWILAERFLNKIFEVQTERLTLAKLLVLAKDTVFSTAEQLDTDPAEKFYLRTRLKIEMLKAHLSKDLNDKLVFPPITPLRSPPKGKAKAEIIE